MNAECPKCGRRTTKISADGRIGFCDYHQEWFAFSPDANGEASEANRKYQEELQRKHDEDERIRIQKERIKQNKLRRAAAFRISVVILGLFLAVLAVLWFKIIPEKRYNEAEELFEKGQYRPAAEKYTELNGYADSNYKVLLCEAFAEIENGNIDRAMEIIGSSDGALEHEAFQLVYDTLMEECRKGTDKGSAVSAWEKFGGSYSSEIEKNGLEQDYTARKNELQLSYAAQLAQEKDPACVAIYEDLMGQGVDVTDSIADILEGAAPGLFRIKLIELLISAVDGMGGDSSEQHGLLEDEVTQCLNEWQDLGVSLEDAYALLEKASGLGIAGIDYQNLPKEWALDAVEAGVDLSDHVFEDLDGDGNDELITATSDGTVSVYSVYLAFSELSSIETQLPSPSFEEVNGMFLLTAGDRSGFSLISPHKDGIEVLKSENGIMDFQREGMAVTYGKELDGSIERVARYSYSLEDPQKEPVPTQIDWGEDSYTYPETPEQTVQRYFEARGYNIPEEERLLTAGDGMDDKGFSSGGLSSLPLPEEPYHVDVSSYENGDDHSLLEARYASGGKDTVKYFAAIKDPDTERWMIAGAADMFAAGMEEAKMDQSIALLPTNTDTTGHLENRDDKDAYRVLLPEASKVQIVWRAGEKQGHSTAFDVDLYDANDMTGSIVSYGLRLSPSKQVGSPLFLPAGVYYLQVSADKYEDTEYHLILQTEQTGFFEQEDNNTAEKASVIQVNQPCSASLFEKEDIDWFRFTVEEPGSISVTMETAADHTTRQTLYIAQVLDSTGERILTQCELAGDQEKTGSGNVYLREGDYYVRINRGSSWTSLEYQVEVNFSGKGDAEKEVNDTFDAATPIQVNQDMTGSFGTPEDIDCYSFYIGQDMILQPKLSFTPLETSSKTYVVTLYDEGRPLYSAKVGGKENDKVLTPFPLNTGTYYVKVENPSFVQQDYTLRLAVAAVEKAETEPNDGLANATAVEFGKPVSGILSTEEDIDYYKLSLDTETIVTLEFTFQPDTGSSTAFSIQLEQNGKKLWSKNVARVSGEMSQRLQIPAGEYYLRIKPGSWMGGVYKLTVTI